MLDRESIRQTLIGLIEADMGESYRDLEEAADLRQNLGLDSVDVVSIVSQIERRFRIRLTHQELEQLTTVGSLLDLIQTSVGRDSSQASVCQAYPAGRQISAAAQPAPTLADRS